MDEHNFLGANGDEYLEALKALDEASAEVKRLRPASFANFGTVPKEFVAALNVQMERWERYCEVRDRYFTWRQSDA